MIFYYNIFIYIYIAIYILYIIYIISYFLFLRVYILLYIYIYIYILLLYIYILYYSMCIYIYIIYYAIEGFLKWGYPVAWKNRVYLGTSLRRAFSAMLTIKNLHNIFIVGRQDDEPKFT